MVDRAGLFLMFSRTLEYQFRFLMMADRRRSKGIIPTFLRTLEYLIGGAASLWALPAALGHLPNRHNFVSFPAPNNILEF